LSTYDRLLTTDLTINTQHGSHNLFQHLQLQNITVSKKLQGSVATCETIYYSPFMAVIFSNFGYRFHIRKDW